MSSNDINAAVQVPNTWFMCCASSILKCLHQTKPNQSIEVRMKYIPCQYCSLQNMPIGSGYWWGRQSSWFVSWSSFQTSPVVLSSGSCPKELNCRCKWLECLHKGVLSLRDLLERWRSLLLSSCHVIQIRGREWMSEWNPFWWTNTVALLSCDCVKCRDWNRWIL